MSKSCVVCNKQLGFARHDVLIGDKEVPFCTNHGRLFDSHIISFDEDGNVLSKYPDEINKDGYNNKVDISGYDKEFLDEHREEYFNYTEDSRENALMDDYVERIEKYLSTTDTSNLNTEIGRIELGKVLVGIFSDIYNSDYACIEIFQKEEEGFMLVPANITMEYDKKEYVGLITLWMKNGGSICGALIIHPENGIVDVETSEKLGAFDYKPLVKVQEC